MIEINLKDKDLFCLPFSMKSFFVKIAFWAIIGFFLGETLKIQSRKTGRFKKLTDEEIFREIDKLQKHIGLVDQARFSFEDLKESRGETHFTVLNVHTQWEKRCYFEEPLVIRTNSLIHDLVDHYPNKTRTVTLLYGRDSLITKGETSEYRFQVDKIHCML